MTFMVNFQELKQTIILLGAVIHQIETYFPTAKIHCTAVILDQLSQHDSNICNNSIHFEIKSLTCVSP